MLYIQRKALRIAYRHINEVTIAPRPNTPLAKKIFMLSDTNGIPPENPSEGEKRDTQIQTTAKLKQIIAANTSSKRLCFLSKIMQPATIKTMPIKPMIHIGA